jgi:hypothetical protein
MIAGAIVVGAALITEVKYRRTGSTRHSGSR